MLEHPLIRWTFRRQGCSCSGVFVRRLCPRLFRRQGRLFPRLFRRRGCSRCGVNVGFCCRLSWHLLLRRPFRRPGFWWPKILTHCTGNNRLRKNRYNTSSNKCCIALLLLMQSKLASIAQKNKQRPTKPFEPPRSRAICNRHWQWHTTHPPQARIRTLPNRSWQASIKRTSRAQQT